MKRFGGCGAPSPSSLTLHTYFPTHKEEDLRRVMRGSIIPSNSPVEFEFINQSGLIHALG
jgi:hypothetical protein